MGKYIEKVLADEEIEKFKTATLSDNEEDERKINNFISHQNKRTHHEIDDEDEEEGLNNTGKII